MSAALPVPISNPGKLYWPDDGITKLELVMFYDSIRTRINPYIKDRPLTLKRCPDGMLGQCFYQKDAPPGLPPGTPTTRVASITDGRITNYVVAGSRATLLGVVNLGCIEIHTWGSRPSNPDRPDWMCFDLDPQSGTFADAARAGPLVKEVLDALKLPSFPKTSGSRGLHIFVPLKVGPSQDEVRELASRIGEVLAAAHPSLLTVAGRIKDRGNKVYLDAFRNGTTQTVAAAYSVRRRPHAPVSTPLAWSEVRPDLDPATFNIRNFAARLRKKDPWATFWKRRATIGAALRAVRSL